MSVLTGCYLDATNAKGQLQRFLEGLDVNQVGGNIIIAGVRNTVPNVYQYAFNKAIVVGANKYK